MVDNETTEPLPEGGATQDAPQGDAPETKTEEATE